MPLLPSSVLYVCAMNRVRSPMAAALTRKLYGDAVQVESSGLRASDDVDPMAAAVMQEVGVELFDHKPRPMGDVDLAGFEVIVALSPDARSAIESLAIDGAEVDYWPVSDPTLVEGSREQTLEAYRDTRRELEARIVGRFGPPPEWE
ncbi:MAG: arsenate-mycothiol transferase ArsC [Caulobacteraceae bacterium]